MIKKLLIVSLLSYILVGCNENRSTVNGKTETDTVVTEVSAVEYAELSPPQQIISKKRHYFTERFLRSPEQRSSIQREWFNWLNTYLIDSLSANATNFHCKINYRSSDLLVGNYIVLGEFDIGNNLYISTQENFKTAQAQRNSEIYKKLYGVDESKPVTMSFAIKEVDQLLVNRIGETLEDPIISIKINSIKN